MYSSLVDPELEQYSSMQIDSSSKRSKMCEVCKKEPEPDNIELTQIDGCPHTFCSNCMSNKVSVAVKNREYMIDSIPCPKAKEEDLCFGQFMDPDRVKGLLRP